jgi:hypothetical protein
MTNFTPVVTNISSPTRKGFQEITSPRAETIALIRQFARMYGMNYESKRKIYKTLVN